MDWNAVTAAAVRQFGTPCYIAAWRPVQDALGRLGALQGVRPVRHWLSFKTHPVAPLLRSWREEGGGVEIVSEYELLAALREGFEPEHILVNGVAKHTWLPRHPIHGLRVHLDSLAEARGLQALAGACRWHLGLRCQLTAGHDPDDQQFLGQFGLLPEEVSAAVCLLRRAGVEIEGFHFHIRTNVRSVSAYRDALGEISAACVRNGVRPSYVDCGGGLPVPAERAYDQSPKDGDLDLVELGGVFDAFCERTPSVREIWLENGRFVTSDSTVLAVRVLDVKERPDCRYLICDGGRTNHALVSGWERHGVFTLPARNGPSCLTSICGPTCMVWDWLARTELSRDVQVGDCVVWMNAGAYHLPWETRFSHGHAAVVWCDEEERLSLARDREDFDGWWGAWR